MKAQLKLFEENKIKKKELFFSELNIHEKINFKANECGLITVYKSIFNYKNRKLFQPKIKELSRNYLWHHKINSGYENRLRKKEKINLFN